MRSRTYRTRATTNEPGALMAELVAGAVTGVSSVRRMIARTILIVALLVGGAAFIAGLFLGGYFPELANFGGFHQQTPSRLATPRVVNYDEFGRRELPVLPAEPPKPRRPVRRNYVPNPDDDAPSFNQ